MRDRSHSIAEIIHITDPRKKSDTKTSHLKESRSEMKIRQRHGESNDGNDHQKVKPLGNVMLGGHLMEANPLFGCFMTIKTTKNHYESVPDNLRVSILASAEKAKSYAKYLIQFRNIIKNSLSAPL